MTDDPQLLEQIRTKIRNEIVIRFDEVLSLSPPETPYAALLEISDSVPIFGHSSLQRKRSPDLLKNIC